MLTPPFDSLVEHLAAHYPGLGRPLELKPLSFGFAVSNSLFEYTTPSGRFLLKAMAHPTALYGQPDVVERLELVSTAIQELRHARLPVEEIVAGHDDRFVQEYDDHLLRLYVFDSGRAFADPDGDCRRAASALRSLHLEGLSCLRGATRQSLTPFKRAYPLATTASELPALRAFLEEQAVTVPAYAKILEQWDLIEWAVARALSHPPFSQETKCLVHTDFHPRNALFNDDREEATMIDLDNMVIDGRLTCLGFSILRFAFFQQERTPTALDAAMAIFAEQECSKPGFMDDLVHAMIHLEIEKVVRILHRVRTTGQYAAFVDNVCPLHLANLKILRASFCRE